MRVDVAQSEDIPQWLNLAAEVEWLFGPMGNERGFHPAPKAGADKFFGVPFF